ncbi:sialidase family protein [Isoptericola croceus]|uniref:sialidase family protein n=1 Tax=Isoptericola croceus TaxID=3031406 RepID=UPI0023F9CD7E|nr:sialidase family protein [Isoptericola croceus]
MRRRWVAVDHDGWSQAHGSTVLTHAGDVLAAWFAGTREGTADNRVWLARRGPRGPWEEPVVVDAGDVARWNPVLAHGPAGDLWLFLRRGARISAWTTWVRRSSDGGRSWVEVAELVTGDVGGRGPVKNSPVTAPDGAWLAPGSTEEWGDRLQWQPFVDRSEDGGRTWQAAPIPLDRSRLRGAGAIQPALWVRDGRVHALLRSAEGRALSSSSTDGGRTWSVADLTGLPNNNSGLTVVSLPGGRVACVHNPVAGDWGARCPLVVSVSDDDGQTWRQMLTVEDGVTPIDDDPFLIPSAPPPGPAFEPADRGVGTDGTGEYSYPAAVLDGDTLLVTYTWQRRGIVEALVPLKALATYPTTSLPPTERRP